MPLSDDDLERLMAAGDPSRPEILEADAVVAARERLGARLKATLDPPVAKKQRGHHESRRHGPTPRLQRTVASAALVAALALVATGIAALSPGHSAGGASLGVGSASAATVLNRLADRAADQHSGVIGPDQFEYVKTIDGVSSAGSATDASGQAVGVRFWQTSIVQSWLDRVAVRRQDTTDVREEFFSAEDRRIAVAHHMTLAQLDHVAPSAPGSEDVIYPARTSGMTGLNSGVGATQLPSNRAALLRVLERGMRAVRDTPTPAAIFNVIGGGLLYHATSPAVRATLFHVLADLSGVRVLGWRRDQIGRRGVAIAYKHGNLALVVIVDPQTANELESELIATGPYRNPPAPAFPQNTAVTYTVYVSRAIVNSISDLPDGGRLTTAGASRGGYVTSKH